jgi:hypothetical protein
MSIPELLRWQWRGYARYHQNRTNLLLHIWAVPLFMLASVLVVVAVVTFSLGLLIVAMVGMVLSVAIQGRGHKLEPVPPEPFTGRANLIGRLFFEQWVTFPRFVLSRGWWHNFVRSNKTETARLRR